MGYWLTCGKNWSGSESQPKNYWPQQTIKKTAKVADNGIGNEMKKLDKNFGSILVQKNMAVVLPFPNNYDVKTTAELVQAVRKEREPLYLQAQKQ